MRLKRNVLRRLQHLLRVIRWNNNYFSLLRPWNCALHASYGLGELLGVKCTAQLTKANNICFQDRNLTGNYCQLRVMPLHKILQSELLHLSSHFISNNLIYNTSYKPLISVERSTFDSSELWSQQRTRRKKKRNEIAHSLCFHFTYIKTTIKKKTVCEIIYGMCSCAVIWIIAY